MGRGREAVVHEVLGVAWVQGGAFRGWCML